MPTLTTDEYGKHMGCNQQVNGGGLIIEQGNNEKSDGGNDGRRDKNF